MSVELIIFIAEYTVSCLVLMFSVMIYISGSKITAPVYSVPPRSPMYPWIDQPYWIRVLPISESQVDSGEILWSTRHKNKDWSLLPWYGTWWTSCSSMVISYVPSIPIPHYADCQAGEDLDEDEDDDDEAEDDLDAIPTYSQLENGSVEPNQLHSRTPFSRAGTNRSMGAKDVSGERQPLLRNGTAGPGTLSRGVSKSRHRRMKSGSGQGTASFTQAVLMVSISPSKTKVFC